MRFARSLLVLAAVGAGFAASHPALDKRIQDPEKASYHEIEKRFAQPDPATSAPPPSSYPTGVCNVNAAQMPVAPTPLPPPSAGLTLTHVAIGRGTQNYTCANNTAQAAPVQVGALATLFNATCLAAPYPQLLALMPNISLKFPVPSATNVLSPANYYLSGHHFFEDLTTPFFNLDTDTHSWGTVACKKLNATNAPNAAVDAPWLKLASKTSDGCSIEEVYRVNTAGGQPPKTCAGQPANIEVQYAAEYWFYSGSKSS